jgi:hypothetical protein
LDYPKQMMEFTKSEQEKRLKRARDELASENPCFLMENLYQLPAVNESINLIQKYRYSKSLRMRQGAGAHPRGLGHHAL